MIEKSFLIELMDGCLFILYGFDGGMLFLTKLMEGFIFILRKIDGGIPVYSLWIWWTAFNYSDGGVPFQSLCVRWRDAYEIGGGILIYFLKI